MPKPLIRVSIIYFFSWLSFFPVNYKTTTYFAQDIYGNMDPSSSDYTKGVDFGMLVLAIQNTVVLFYSPIQDYVVQKIGYKWTYASSQIINAICFIPIFFVKNKWLAFSLFIPIGISCSTFNSIPYTILGLSVPTERMALYVGVLNSFCVMGQQVSTVLCLGMGKIKDGWVAPSIGIGAVFAIISAVLCYWMIIPSVNINQTPLLTAKEI